MSVRDIDRGARQLVARLRGLAEGAKLTIGTHAEEAAANHVSGGVVGDIATILEIGTHKRAPRGYVRATIESARPTLASRLADAGAEVLRRGGGQVEAFGPVAAELAADMRARVPVDTGEVRDSIRAKVNGTEVG